MGCEGGQRGGAYKVEDGGVKLAWWPFGSVGRLHGRDKVYASGSAVEDQPSSRQASTDG